MNFKTFSIDKFCSGPAVEIKPEEKALIEDEKEIIELVKKEREKEIDLIRVKEYVKPIVFPYKKVVKVYEKPIGKPILSISRLSFFLSLRNFRNSAAIESVDRMGTVIAVSSAPRGLSRALA